ncbi:MAG: FprA family A-type flavoprotein [Candidatus Zapsychrus exili]|nr:FprA family A-type flavoprotein [Candidatus Zapsychrus exili]
MKSIEIKKGIYWVGAIDWDLRSFHGYLTQRGSTYNSYLIVDDKITLVDTVKHQFYDEMLERIKEIIDPEKIDYIVCNHVEMDHSGALPDIMQVCKNAEIVTCPNGEKGLNLHYKGNDWKFKVINTGDSLNIGKRNLNFVLTPMVHWPDSMVTYIPEDKLLLSNDSFGQHIASDERFDDELEWDTVYYEAAKYYANIVLPYGNQVVKELEAASGLDINMIAPSHGIIWRENIGKIIESYTKWANNKMEDKAAIVYDTMWDSTAVIAQAIQDAFDGKGIQSRLISLQDMHISDVMTYLLDAKYLCVGSPTLNSGMLPAVAAFLCYLKGLAPKGRTGLAFGSYGWGGQSIKEIETTLSGCGFEMLESIKVQYVPDENQINEIKDKSKGEIS